MPGDKYLKVAPPDSPFVKDLKEGLWTTLPLKGWRGLLFLALNRLVKRDPVLAELLYHEAQALAKTWELMADEPKSARRLLAEELGRLESRPLSRGKVKPRPNYPIGRLLAIYEDVCDRLRTAKAAVREAQKQRKRLANGFWESHVEAILHSLGDPWRRAPIPPTLVEGMRTPPLHRVP